ncbi:hypothetical protein J6590_009435 [Homalodisca vitripennis]|nr:hypothetical protein J6590_009435 [Homalodisca vitripennis]
MYSVVVSLRPHHEDVDIGGEGNQERPRQVWTSVERLAFKTGISTEETGNQRPLAIGQVVEIGQPIDAGSSTRWQVMSAGLSRMSVWMKEGINRNDRRKVAINYKVQYVGSVLFTILLLSSLGEEYAGAVHAGVREWQSHQKLYHSDLIGAEICAMDCVVGSGKMYRGVSRSADWLECTASAAVVGDQLGDLLQLKSHVRDSADILAGFQGCLRRFFIALGCFLFLFVSLLVMKERLLRLLRRWFWATRPDRS